MSFYPEYPNHKFLLPLNSATKPSAAHSQQAVHFALDAVELILASQNSNESFSCGKRNESEKQADAAR